MQQNVCNKITVNSYDKRTLGAILIKNIRILSIRKKQCKHLELLFLTVFALPSASKTGFDCIYSIESREYDNWFNGSFKEILERFEVTLASYF